jgi:hypothetical protein
VLTIYFGQYEERTGLTADGIHGKALKRKVSAGTRIDTQLLKRSRRLSLILLRDKTLHLICIPSFWPSAGLDVHPQSIK